MSPAVDDPRLEELWADHAIHQVLLRYCRGIDRLDEALVRACYHPDARDERGTFEGGVDELVDWSFRLLQRFTMTTHHLANVLVEVAGPVALAESYLIAHHRSTTEPTHPGRNFSLGFRFVDRFEERGGEWRIAHRVGITEWHREEVGPPFVAPEGTRSAARDGADVVQWLVPEVSGPAAAGGPQTRAT